MGNCQASEAAMVVIQHPESNKTERIYWSVSANEVMSSNPGHYVALVITSPSSSTMAKSEMYGAPLKQLKLLRPDDTLLIGHVYRLISFEDVLKEFSAKKCVKLGKLLRESGGLNLKKKEDSVAPTRNSEQKSSNATSSKVEQEVYRIGSSSSGSSSSTISSNVNRGGMGRLHGGGVQWKPALQSIAEVGN